MKIYILWLDDTCREFAHYMFFSVWNRFVTGTVVFCLKVKKKVKEKKANNVGTHELIPLFLFLSFLYSNYTYIWRELNNKIKIYIKILIKIKNRKRDLCIRTGNYN